MGRITLLVAALAVVAGTVLTTALASGARKPATRTFQVAMTGDAESPAGDPVATGTAVFRLRAGQAKVCYTLSAKNLPRAVAAHIHRGAKGKSGNVVVPLKTPNAAGKSSGCAKTTKAVVRAILARPAAYYANVHTAEFPNGAIRGQLRGSSTSSFGRVITRTLNGTTEPNATGRVVLRFRPGQICYRLTVGNITLPAFASHIHKGTAGTNGPVVVPLEAPGTSGTSDGCVTVEQSLIDEILGNPSGFYVNVHTTEHKAGAARAQLA